MTDSQKILKRVQEECRAAGSKIRETARRTYRQGLLRVDLVSLRRDRGRALSDLGERVMRLWSADDLPSLPTDEEASRLRAVIGSIEQQIAAKEAEAATLRHTPPDSEPAAPVVTSHP